MTPSRLTIVSLAFGAVYTLLSIALRIPELPSIVGVMADVLRRPSRSASWPAGTAIRKRARP